MPSGPSALLMFLLLLASTASAAAGGAAPPPADDDAQFFETCQRAGKAFLSRAPVREAVTEDDLRRLENPPGANRAENDKWDGVKRVQKIARLAQAIELADRVQQERNPQVRASAEYRQNIMQAVRNLCVGPQFVPHVIELYAAAEGSMAQGGPRRVNPAQAAAEAEGLKRMLANPSLPAGERARVEARMAALALGLGSSVYEEAPATVLASFGAPAPMNRADFARLNSERGPGPNSLRWEPIPSPAGSKGYGGVVSYYNERARNLHAAQTARQVNVLAEADREANSVTGIASDARRYWADLDRQVDPNEGALARIARKAAAKTFGTLLDLSGLPAVERSAARAGYVAGSGDVQGWEKTKAFAALGGNMALSAATFVPVAGMASRFAQGERALTLLRPAGTAVIAAATPKAAEAISTVGGRITAAVGETLPSVGKPNTAELQSMFGRLNEIGREYGLNVKVGGTAGESVAQGGTISASLAAGAPHESLHVVQQVYNRAAALERAAAKLGTTVAGLSPEARAGALAQAGTFEKAAYLQHEAQAFYATGFGGAGRADYAARLTQTVADLRTANIGGTVVKGNYGAGATAYGATGALLGDSQKALFMNGYWASSNLIYPVLNGATNSALDWATGQ